jgi:hypothetical protein
MKNKIIFTQDLPGEREWLHSLYPDFTILETVYSGKWPSVFPKDSDERLIWEIPPESTIDVTSLSCEKIKSLYTLDHKFIHSRWCDSNSLIVNNLQFSNRPKSSRVQVLTFNRCGTVFAESILYKKCGYTLATDKPYDDAGSFHTFLGGNDLALYSTVRQTLPDIFLTYRSDWWGWASSLLIAHKFGYHHYNSDVSWETMDAITISPVELTILSAMARANWQALCHFRTIFPHLNFYILEFADIIQQSNRSDHKGIKYDKRKLIKNYDELQSTFNKDFLPQLKRWEENCVRHLIHMKCEKIRSLDNFIVE